jgi:hypothetical protein
MGLLFLPNGHAKCRGQTRARRVRAMDVFIYSTIPEKKEEELVNIFKPVLPQEKIELYRTLEDFSLRLKHPVPPNSIVLLAPGSRQELLRILSTRDLLHDLRTIVIVPDHETETVAIAHQFRPRYLAYLNGGFGEVAAVVGKMITGHPPAGFFSIHS